ncbi:MAG: ribosomal-processing cysteine protease Prp [Firmicutes bacterium]|nr:ribosomal-processing cysteine protease Prp [Bacillota bacterium]
MIVVRIVRDSNQHIEAFSISGHSGYAQRGQDIVCAGVSAIVQTTILGLQEVLGVKCTGNQAEGKLECTLPRLEQEMQHKTDILLDTMLLGLTAIATSYPKHVRILDSKEV